MKETAPQGERLQKVLARAGIASRRAAEDLILAGRVQVNGQMVTELGTRVDPARDRIVVDGRPVLDPALPAEDRVTYLLHKPLGVVSTAADPQGRPTVVSLVPEAPRVYPVGRLDADTEGLLLLTNDGDLAFRLTHPRYGVDKEYEVLVRGTLESEALRKLREGVLLEGEPRPTAPAIVDIIKKEDGNTLLRFVIHEGRKRQIRRMIGAVGGHVNRLRRVRFGPLTLGDLPPGGWRRVTSSEIRTLDHAAGGAAPAEPARTEKGGRRGAHPARSAPDARPGGPRPRPGSAPARPAPRSRPAPDSASAPPARRSRSAPDSAPGRPAPRRRPAPDSAPAPPPRRSRPAPDSAPGRPAPRRRPAPDSAPARPAPGSVPAPPARRSRPAPYTPPAPPIRRARPAPHTPPAPPARRARPAPDSAPAPPAPSRRQPRRSNDRPVREDRPARPSGPPRPPRRRSRD